MELESWGQAVRLVPTSNAKFGRQLAGMIWSGSVVPQLVPKIPGVQSGLSGYLGTQMPRQPPSGPGS